MMVSYDVSSYIGKLKMALLHLLRPARSLMKEIRIALLSIDKPCAVTIQGRSIRGLPDIG
jgi:hypothetical protein